MDCETCKNYDKEVEYCNAHPKDLTDLVCIGRNLIWTLLMEDIEDGEDWKIR